ncbi:MAG: hypothetical protein AAF752_00460 [Bacteroidota bacterium]
MKTLMCIAAVVSLFGFASDWYENTRQLSVVVDGSDEALTERDGRLWRGHERFTGTVRWTYPDGTPQRTTVYVEGRRHGDDLTWYDDGTPRSVRRYDDGEKTGQHAGWWADGTPQFRFQFEADQHVGDNYRWYANGVMSEHLVYAHGVEAGRQQTWWEDGRVRANYVVKDGRRFGLMGPKGCG